MPDISAMKDLLARVESATGADRELDGEVHYLLVAAIPKGYTRIPSGDGWLRAVRAGGVVRSEKSPPYTASLDACIALIETALPSMNWQVTAASPDGCYAGVFERGWRDVTQTSGEGKTSPLALLAATLRALLQIEERKAGGEGE